jgi:hypothetical protein
MKRSNLLLAVPLAFALLAIPTERDAVLATDPTYCQYSSTNKNCPHANNKYTYGRQESSYLYLTIHNSVPNACRLPIYEGRQVWNNANIGFSFIWNGYTSSLSRTVSGGRLVATSANRWDTVDIAVGDTVSSYAAAETSIDWSSRFQETTDPERRRWYIRDGDMMIRPATIASAYCGTGTVPTDKIHIQNLVAHELGHAMGMAHKLQDQVAADVMNGWNFKGPRPLTPSTNDLSSAQWLYGTR